MRHEAFAARLGRRGSGRHEAEPVTRSGLFSSTQGSMTVGRLTELEWSALARTDLNVPVIRNWNHGPRRPRRDSDRARPPAGARHRAGAGTRARSVPGLTGRLTQALTAGPSHGLPGQVSLLCCSGPSGAGRAACTGAERGPIARQPERYSY